MARKAKVGKGFKRFIVFVIVAAIIAAAVCCLGFTSRNSSGKWFGGLHWAEAPQEDKPDTPDTPLIPATVVGDGGAVLTAFSSKGGAMFRSAAIAKTSYEAYGIEPYSDGAYSINVINETSDTLDTYTWESSNPEAVSIASVSEDTRTATIVCNGEFAQTITVTATSTFNSDINASCLVDYAKRITGVTCNLDADYYDQFEDDEGNNIYEVSGTENFRLSSTSTANVGVIRSSIVDPDITTQIKNLTLTAIGGVGTIEDYDASQKPTVRLSVINSLKSEIQSKLGVTLNPVEVNEMLISKGCSYRTDKAIMQLFQGTSQTQAFTLLQQYKNSGTAVLQYEFSFIGKYTGNTYTVCTPVIFDFSDFFEKVGISLTPDHVIF